MSQVNKTHAQRVREILEAEIINGTLRPGDRVDEDGVAARLNVSRTPVREAVLQLVQVGLMEKQPRQGAFVTHLDVRKMVQMFEYTAELSGISAKYAARRMTAEDRAALLKIHHEMEKLLNKGDIDSYADLNTEFHVYIMRQCRNSYLFDANFQLGTRLLAYFRTYLFFPGKAERDFHDHCTLIGAFERGDGDLAYQLLRQHATIQGDVFAEFLSRTNEPLTMSPALLSEAAE
jgi:DNA-binding GntR family transcriptional regulator